MVLVLSYNILSSHLADESWLCKCKPEDLDWQSRLPKIMGILKEYVEQRAIICLQEMSMSAEGHFHLFFSQHGYRLISARYGSTHSNYMGNATAIPEDLYTLEGCDIRCPTRDFDLIQKNKYLDSYNRRDRRRGSRTPAATPPPLTVTTCLAGVWDSLKSMMSKLENVDDKPWASSDAEEDCHWLDNCFRRWNQVILVHLRDTKQNTSFVVANYHAPCFFGSPNRIRALVAYNAVTANLVNAYSEKLGHRPYILAGDFNMAPTSGAHAMITQGYLPKGHEEYPELDMDQYDCSGFKWKCRVKQPLRSAYATFQGHEPEFTNWSFTERNNEDFVETLDYLFISKEWSVSHVREMPTRQAVEGPLPNAVHGSDHLPVAAAFELFDDYIFV